MTKYTWTPAEAELAINNIWRSVKLAQGIPLNAIMGVVIEHRGNLLDAQGAIVEIAHELSRLHAIVQNYKSQISMIDVPEIEYV